MKEKSNMREIDFIRMFFNIEGLREIFLSLCVLIFELRFK